MNENQKLTMMAMADHLEFNVTDDQFDLEVWSRPSAECGTVGCAIGHTVYLIHGLELRHPRLNIAGNGVLPALVPAPGQETLYGSYAIQHALGLTSEEASWLFYPNAVQPLREDESFYYTREQVYSRIRGFAKGELECPL